MQSHGYESRLLRIDEAAAYLNVAPRTIRHFIHTGRLAVVRLHGGNTAKRGLVRIEITELDDFIRRGKQPR